MFVIVRLDEQILSNYWEIEPAIPKLLLDLDAVQLSTAINVMKRNHGPFNAIKWIKYLRPKLELMLKDETKKVKPEDWQEVDIALEHLYDKGEISETDWLSIRLGKKLKTSNRMFFTETQASAQARSLYESVGSVS